ncbi:phage repressor protein [Haloferax sp. Atlit-19N]|uniref:MarR family transcriptional regulator n=1 Tax=Haloferax sp. Atlit-19N TaxID=2077201 RepID=UPI000E26463C|nr:MarR family transcriptional regulator [Haloferax sp. Atlit-19N]RDZ39372.1 phage repressor protein [Haloferax sp. Atlit-19N]
MSSDDAQEMVERISWFSPVDYEILLFFEKHDIGVSPKIMAYNIEYDRQYVYRRLKVLNDADLLINDDGVYRLSDFGRKFLAGNVDEDELPEP